MMISHGSPRAITRGPARWLAAAAGVFTMAAVLQFSSVPAAGQGRDFDRDDVRDRDRDRSPSRRDNDDLLRSLIESELQRREIRRTEPRGTPAPAGRIIDSPTDEMLDARKILAEIARDADDLATLLNDEARRNPELRTYMTDVLKLRARVSIVADRARNQNDHQMLAEDLRGLDRDWRVLAVRLSQVRGLDRRVLASVERINGEAKELAQILDIKPQMNRRELSRLASQLTTDLSNLMEDISIDLARSQQRDQLLAAGRRVRQQAGLLSNSVDDNRDYSIVLDDYKQFVALWNPFASSLRPFQLRSLDRHVRRISEANSGIQEMLWIPHQMDRQQLLYLTDALKRDVDEFFARTPLKLLIDLPDTRLVLPTAHEFYGVCSNFTDSVNNDDSESEIVDAFRYIESAHRSFNDVFKSVNSQAALQVLRQIDVAVRDLRDAMNLQGGTGNRRIADLAGLVDNLASQLETDVRRWLDRYRAPYRGQALQDTAAFAQQARRLNESIALGDDPSRLSRDVTLLYESWRRVFSHISKCDTDDREHLQSLSTQITPAIIELQTLIAP